MLTYKDIPQEQFDYIFNNYRKFREVLYMLVPTGMVRKVDELGRVVIPKELRRRLGIEDDKDFFEIYMDGDSIVLKKYQPNCIFCGNMESLVSLGGKNVCAKCVQDLKDKL